MAQQISAFPPVPLLTDTPEVFDPKAVSFNLFLANTFVSEANALSTEVESNALSAESDAASAALSETNAATSAGESADSAALSQEWAVSTSLVAGADYSAKQWATADGIVSGGLKSAKGYAEEAAATVGTIPEGTINDAITTLTDTWSSQKISDELDLKRDITDTSFPRYDLSSVATTDTLDLDVRQVFRVDASSPRTLAFANAPGADRAMTVVVHIAGNSAVTWPAGIDWDSDAAPELGDNETKVVLFWDGIEWSGFTRVAK